MGNSLSSVSTRKRELEEGKVATAGREQEEAVMETEMAPDVMAEDTEETSSLVSNHDMNEAEVPGRGLRLVEGEDEGSFTGLDDREDWSSVDDDVSFPGQVERDTLERVRQNGLHRTIREMLEEAVEEQEQLEQTALAYSARCRQLYNTIILKTTQDSTRTTLESIVAAKMQQTKLVSVRPVHCDKEQADIQNIAVAVKTFGDRQDVLAREMDACHKAFKSAREEYQQVKAKLGDTTNQLGVVDGEMLQRLGQLQPRRNDTRRDNDPDLWSAYHDVEEALRLTDENTLKTEQKVQRELRFLRVEYYQNQPPPPVTV